MSDPLIGRLLGGSYQIEAKLGAGGMGVVYAARHVRTGRSYAVKVLLPEAAERPAALARFRLEAEAVSALGHASIIAVHDFDQTEDGLAYIVMNKLEGEDLAERLHQVGVLSFEESRRILRELAGALSEAHRVGVLHRDIKPSNIFLATTPGAPERAVLLDFGLVKMMGDDASKLTATGLTLGTPAYMSPEQARGIEVDERTDVYSLAATLFEMLSGQAPFVAPHPTALIARLLADPPPRLSTVARSAIPAELDELLVRCLAKSPHERPSSVLELSVALDAMGPAVTVGATVPDALPSTRAFATPAGVTPRTHPAAAKPGAAGANTPATRVARPTPAAHATGGRRAPLVIGASIVVAAGILGAALLLPALLSTDGTDVGSADIASEDIASGDVLPTELAQPPDVISLDGALGQVGFEAQDIVVTAAPDAGAEDAAAVDIAPDANIVEPPRGRRRRRPAPEPTDDATEPTEIPVSMDGFRANLPPQDQSEYDAVAAAVARMEVQDWQGCIRISRAGPRRFRTLSTWFSCANRLGDRQEMEAACAAAARSLPARHSWPTTCRTIIDAQP